jgi:hypothetical protein
MRFTIEMDDGQYQRLTTQLANAGVTMEDAIVEQRLVAVYSGMERIIPWAEVRAFNGL